MTWNRIRRASALMVAGAFVLLTGCATNTMTGRTQMSRISDAEVSKKASLTSAPWSDYREKKLVDTYP